MWAWEIFKMDLELDMVYFDVLTEQGIDPIIAVELLELKEKQVLISWIEKEWLIGQVKGWLFGFYGIWTLMAKSKIVQSLWKGRYILICFFCRIVDWGEIFSNKWCTHKEM